MSDRICKAVLITTILLFSLWPSLGVANTTTGANTVEVNDGPLVGHSVPGMIVMNAPCSFGDHYHYTITSLGELRTEAPLVCGNIKNSRGGQLVCYLDPQMRCQARPDFAGGPETTFVINGTGVKTGNKMYAWADPQQAIALMPSIQTRAKDKCNTTLFWQALDAKRKTPITPSVAKVRERESCKPTLEQVCASANGGPAKLDNGKDVSVLCPR